MFVLNAAPAAHLPADLLSRCDVLVVNEHELAVVAGVDGADDVDAITSAHEGLRNRGVGAVVTTRGSAGAVVTDDDGATTVLDAVPAEVVDTTGAGDAFAAGLLAAWLPPRELDPAAAMDAGLALAADVVRRPGAR
jgi:ribokinase